MRICNASSRIDHPTEAGKLVGPGTLLWIGDRDSIEFQDAFHYCDQNVPQMAVRRDLAEAIARGADLVDRIVFARVSRHPISTAEVRGLATTYPQAMSMQLRGPLCEGDRYDLAWTGGRCCWHEWSQVLPAWLRGSTGPEANQRAPRASSVAVIAASMAVADPLMELIVSEGAAAIWCRRPDALRVRGVQSVWWDDSVAAPASESQWQQRLATCGASSEHCQHVWLVNAPRREACQAARRGGVSQVLGKPFRIACLADAVSRVDASGSQPQQPQRSVIAA